MPDIGFTHVALPVTSLQASIEFYDKYAGLRVVHRRAQGDDPNRGIAWLSDCVRPFVLVLVEASEVDAPLGPFAHLGVACPSRESVDQLCEAARAEGRLRKEPWDSESPAGYLAMLSDPDGHTLELSYGQQTGLAVESESKPEPGDDE